VFDPKISGLVAGIAFILSLLFGLLAGAAFLTALLRAGIFAVFFFVFSGIVYWLITQYIPELLESPSHESSDSVVDIPDLGSKVNISQLVKETIEEDEFISEKALDQNVEEGYTREEHGTARTESNEESSPSPALPVGVIDDVDELPDLEGMSDAFVMPISDFGEDSESADAKVSTPIKKAGTSADFDPKEMAMAIQTILKRDQKG
jgi:hypothetical protein